MENVALLLEILQNVALLLEIVTSDRELVAIPDGTMCDTPRSHDRRHDLTTYSTTSRITSGSQDLLHDLWYIFQIQKIVANRISVNKA